MRQLEARWLGARGKEQRLLPLGGRPRILTFWFELRHPLNMNRLPARDPCDHFHA